jgi:hypothetical protein
MVHADSSLPDEVHGQEMIWEIDTGWDVYGADGHKIGDVHDVQPYYIVVARGFFFPTERYVPVSAIVNVEHERVYLNVTQAEIDARGWEVAPAERVEDGTVAGHDEPRMTPDVGGEVGPVAPVQPSDAVHGRYDLPAVAVKQDTGNPSARPQAASMDAPLRVEDIRVERSAGGGYGDEDLPDDVFQETTYVIPIRGEEIVVSKHAVVREEVRLRKEPIARERPGNDGNGY